MAEANTSAAGASMEPFFFINEFRMPVTGHETLSLADFIRQYTPYKGTKLACGEGGCGSCAVQVTRYDTATGKTRTSSLNACLCPVGNLDGVQVHTAEGLGNFRKGFSCVQKAFAKHHASQCGFCTPGFVVACHATLAECQEHGVQATPANMMQGLDGNLCRCTGYRPIIDACKTLTKDMEDLCDIMQPQAVYPEELELYNKKKAQQASLASACQLACRGVDQGHPKWLMPRTLKEAFEASYAAKSKGKSVQFLAGNTGAGVYHAWPSAQVIISLQDVAELTKISRTAEGLMFGAAVPFAVIITELRREVAGKPVHPAWLAMAAHLERIAGAHVRWAATPGGNLALTYTQGLESDFATVLAASGGRLQITEGNMRSRWRKVFDDGGPTPGEGSCLVTCVSIPAFEGDDYYWSHKVAQRYYNAHALINLGVSWRARESAGGSTTLSGVNIAYGYEGDTKLRGQRSRRWQKGKAERAEYALKHGPLTIGMLVSALEALRQDLSDGWQSPLLPDGSEEVPSAAERGEALLFAALVPHLRDSGVEDDRLRRLLRAECLPPPGVPAGFQRYHEPPRQQLPVGLPVEKDRIHLQASGEAMYSSDIGVGQPQLYARVVASTKAHARVAVDPSQALKMPGVTAFVGPEDIPGENAVFLGGADAPIFAEKVVRYVGEPLGLIVAETPQLARQAADAVEVTYDSKGLRPLLSIRDAVEAGSFHEIPDGAGGKVQRGDVESAMAASEHVIKRGRSLITHLGMMGTSAGSSPAHRLDARPVRAVILVSRFAKPSQQHFYMETQVAVAEPQEAGGCVVHSSTQTLDGVQAAVARALAAPAHSITAVCRRAGGGFGGKVARSLPVAAAAAVAAQRAGRRVHYQLDRNQDFAMNGGRSEACFEYAVGFDGQGRISALDVRGWFLAGADLDLAWNDMMIIQTGADQVYAVPNIRLDLRVVKANLPPRTIMRGPGFMDAVMLIEHVLEHVAAHAGLDPEATRRGNFLRGPSPPGEAEGPAAGDEEDAETGMVLVRAPPKGVCARAVPDPPGQAAARGDPAMMKTSLSRPFRADSWTLPRIWDELIHFARYHERRGEVARFNAAHAWRKRGISINPCRFDSNPQPMTALVNIYYDGSVLVAHGGLEIGQGLSTKVKQMAAYALSKLLPEHLRPLPLELIRINEPRSDIVPNSGPTWSSTGSEASCAAVEEACKQLVASLSEAAAKVEAKTATAFWKAAVANVHSQVGFAPASALLSAVGFFDGTERTPGNEPLAYSSFGAAIAEVELDVLTGEKVVRQCDIHFDCGQSLNPMIDRGQVEGALVQGLGYLTSEEVIYDEASGNLLSDGTWTYKPPAASCIPQRLNVTFLEDSPNPRGVLGSKATGEPCLLLSTSIHHALRHAVVAATDELKALPSYQPDHHWMPWPSAGSPSDQLDSEQLNGHTVTPDSKLDGRGADELDHDPFLSLPAPATTTALKKACGRFVIADIIKAASVERGRCGSTDSWEELTSADLHECNKY